MVTAFLLTEDAFRTGKSLSLSKDCFKIHGGLYFRAKEGCFFAQAGTAQRGCEEATGQLACHVRAASDLSSLQFGSGGGVRLEGLGVLQ